jgi:hypothetical protein
MLPRCRTADEPFVIPPFDVQVSDVGLNLAKPKNAAR